MKYYFGLTVVEGERKEVSKKIYELKDSLTARLELKVKDHRLRSKVVRLSVWDFE